MKKNKSARRRKIKVSGSERRLKICAVVISLLFTVLMLQMHFEKAEKE